MDEININEIKKETDEDFGNFPEGSRNLDQTEMIVKVEPVDPLESEESHNLLQIQSNEFPTNENDQTQIFVKEETMDPLESPENLGNFSEESRNLLPNSSAEYRLPFPIDQLMNTANNICNIRNISNQISYNIDYNNPNYNHLSRTILKNFHISTLKQFHDLEENKTENSKYKISDLKVRKSWSLFCEFINKTFWSIVEKDVSEFFEMLTVNGFTPQLCSLVKSHLEIMYLKKTGKKFPEMDLKFVSLNSIETDETNSEENLDKKEKFVKWKSKVKIPKFEKLQKDSTWNRIGEIWTWDRFCNFSGKRKQFYEHDFCEFFELLLQGDVTASKFDIIRDEFEFTP